MNVKNTTAFRAKKLCNQITTLLIAEEQKITTNEWISLRHWFRTMAVAADNRIPEKFKEAKPTVMKGVPNDTQN